MCKISVTHSLLFAICNFGLARFSVTEGMKKRTYTLRSRFHVVKECKLVSHYYIQGWSCIIIRFRLKYWLAFAE